MQEEDLLLDRMEIWNGDTVRAKEEEWTFTGNSVIDYVIGKVETKERIERLEIAIEKIDSDHHLGEKE